MVKSPRLSKICIHVFYKELTHNTKLMVCKCPSTRWRMIVNHKCCKKAAHSKFHTPFKRNGMFSYQGMHICFETLPWGVVTIDIDLYNLFPLSTTPPFCA